MRSRRQALPSLPVTPRVRPRGMDEADWVDMLSSVSVDDELASRYDSQLCPGDCQDKDLEDYIDRRGLELDLE